MPELKRDLENYAHLKSKAMKLFREGKIEQSLDYAYVAATYIWETHLGIWYDSDLEELLEKIAEHIKEKIGYASKQIKNKDQKREKANVKHIAHIVSSLYDVGGHSEVLNQWITILKNLVDNQTLYITNSSNMPTKYSCLDNFKREGIKIKQLSWKDRYVDRIKELIKFLETDSPDLVILYIHPNDVIAVAALLALSKRPYAVFFNHADHVFWLGRNVTDLLIEWRSEAKKYSRMFRKINKSYLIPLTTNINPKKDSKVSYGIPTTATLSVSIGSFFKVRPDSEWNYFSAIEKILKKFPNHYHLFVTTPQPQNLLEQYLPNDPNVRKRFIITGPFSNLEPIYGIADFLIETFPVIGGMVRVEAMACGLPIIAIRNKRFSLFSESDAIPSDYPFIATTEEDVVTYTSKIIENPELRNQVGSWLYRHYKQNFSPEKVRERLHNLIKDKINIECMSTNIFSENLNYDIEYVYSWYQTFNKFSISRALFIQSILKRSEFSYQDRFKFYTTSLKNKEFKSRKEVLGGIILSVLGWRGGVLYKTLSSSLRKG